ncbi:RHS repeat-associated core domain-containing protein, partial [Psychrobacter celer]
VWLADYQAWGNTAKVVWREEQLEQIQVSSNELQPIRFQGQHFDEETGLHYNRFRYYDPDMGMFTSRDPIGLMGGDNVFQYAPNPIGWVDPLGLVTREAAIKSLANDSSVQPVISAKARHGRNPGRPAKYSEQKINERWYDMYQKDVARHLKAGRMQPCPSSAPKACTSCGENDKWREYVGDSTVYHCGFDGYLENRIPSKRNPAPINECFYDHGGDLVAEGHVDYGCRGTPDYYPSFGGAVSIWNHFKLDAGGPPGPSSSNLYEDISEESKKATQRFYQRNPKQKRIDELNKIPTSPL